MNPRAKEALDRVVRYEHGDADAYPDRPSFGYPGDYVADLRTVIRGVLPSNRDAEVTPGLLLALGFTEFVRPRFPDKPPCYRSPEGVGEFANVLWYTPGHGWEVGPDLTLIESPKTVADLKTLCRLLRIPVKE